MRNSTIGKQMGFLKWFLRWSFKKDYHQNIAYDTFKPKLKTTPKKVIFLTWEELNRLKDYQIPKDKQYLSGTCPGCFPVLLLYQSALFRCS